VQNETMNRQQGVSPSLTAHLVGCNCTKAGPRLLAMRRSTARLPDQPLASRGSSTTKTWKHLKPPPGRRSWGREALRSQAHVRHPSNTQMYPNNKRIPIISVWAGKLLCGAYGRQQLRHCCEVSTQHTAHHRHMRAAETHDSITVTDLCIQCRCRTGRQQALGMGARSGHVGGNGFFAQQQQQQLAREWQMLGGPIRRVDGDRGGHIVAWAVLQ
jgi:hypothetical protein